MTDLENMKQGSLTLKKKKDFRDGLRVLNTFVFNKLTKPIKSDHSKISK